MGFCFSLIRVRNLDYLHGFVVVYFYLAVFNFTLEKFVVVVAVVVEGSCKVQKYVVEKCHLVDLY